MKKLVIIIAALSLWTVQLQGQDVPEKSTTIVISGADSASISAKVNEVLKKKGYTMNKTKAADIYYSNPVQLKNNNRFALNVQYKGKEVYLTGSIAFIGQGNQKVIYNPKKDTPFYLAWEEMTKIAKGCGGTISYK